MNIGIIGSGYVGLVTGSCFAEFGNSVICADIDKNKIDFINSGNVPIYEPGLKKIINENLNKQSLVFTTDIKKTIQCSDIIFITVGTPMNEDGSACLESIFEVAKDIGKYINSYKIIVTKSTIPIGTTLKVRKIIEDSIIENKLSIDFDIANNPEFLKEGKAVNDFMYPDRIIIGLDNAKIKKFFREIYKPFSMNHQKLIFMDIVSSELTKYASNAMLATKISFINEMAIIAEKFGADINNVRLGIGSDSRIGYSFIYPSVGYGGSCFPKDINAIIDSSKKNGYNPNILNAVNTVNINQKKYFYKKIENILNREYDDISNCCIGIWGLSFKPGTDDMRESASIYLVDKLIKLGLKIKVYDPKAMDNAKKIYFKNFPNIEYCQSKNDVLNDSIALVLLTEWPEFRNIDFKLLKTRLKKTIFFDGRNQFKKIDMETKGIKYYCIG